MNIKDAVALALIYKQVPDKMREAYLKLIDSTETEFSLADAKMIRFENESKKVSSIRNICEANITTPNPLNAEDMVEILAYRIQIETGEKGNRVPEKGCRYLYYSKLFTDAFSVRFFNSLKGYERLKKQSKITIISEINFRGAMLAIYSFAGSDVERVAIYCAEDCDLTPELLIKEMNSKVDSANRTCIF